MLHQLSILITLLITRDHSPFSQVQFGFQRSLFWDVITVTQQQFMLRRSLAPWEAKSGGCRWATPLASEGTQWGAFLRARKGRRANESIAVIHVYALTATRRIDYASGTECSSTIKLCSDNDQVMGKCRHDRPATSPKHLRFVVKCSTSFR